jgi:hypothetical protein
VVYISLKYVFKAVNIIAEAAKGEIYTVCCIFRSNPCIRVVKHHCRGPPRPNIYGFVYISLKYLFKAVKHHCRGRKMRNIYGLLYISLNYVCSSSKTSLPRPQKAKYIRLGVYFAQLRISEQYNIIVEAAKGQIYTVWCIFCSYTYGRSSIRPYELSLYIRLLTYGRAGKHHCQDRKRRNTSC